MLKNYFKIAFRNIRKNFTYSFINIFGLAVGLASAIVIGLWVYQEWSYDRHFEDSDRIYRVGVNFMNVGDMAVGPPQLNNYVRDFPEVEKTGRLYGRSNMKVVIGEKEYQQSNVFYADSTFFEVLSYNFVEGSAVTALDQPNSAVLTRETAAKFFGTQPALGQTIQIGEDKEPFQIVGIVDTGDHRSHINASMWLTYTYTENTNWLSANVYNYIKLRESASVDGLKDRLQQLIKERVYPSLSLDIPFEEWIETDGSYRFITMPVTDIYLKSDLKFEPTPGGNYANVVTFFLIALLIILIAAVNFINITTARSSIRAKEVGIRKTLGSSERALIFQFLSESVLNCGIALIIGLGLGEIFLSLFESYTGVLLLEGGIFNLSYGRFFALIATVLLIGILAGLYPAVYLRRYKPAKVLKGQIHSYSGNQSIFRNSLVIVQFTISICLLIGTGVIYQQLDYMRNKDLGLNKDNVLVINNAGILGTQKEAFREELQKFSGVENISYNKRIPAGTSVWVSAMKTRDMQEDLPMQSFLGDYEMIPTLGFTILEGRNFSKEIAADTNAVLLNQSAVRALGLDEPIGSKLNDTYEVIGIVADFNFESLRKKIEPAVLEFDSGGDHLAVKVAGDKQAFIDYAATTWKQFGMAGSINYHFLDSNFEALLDKEQVLGKAVVIFSLLALLISCLGLYGLSAFITEQRTKEIGIRRVLGASTSEIVLLLNQSFTKPVLVSMAIAFPLAFIILKSWLDNFAYKVEISPWIYFGAGLAALGIAWLTVSWQSTIAAQTNPVESLKSE